MKNLITLTVKSTHFYLLPCQGGKLLVDAGWELPKFLNQLKAYDVPVSSIRYVMFTHHHPDHAGLIQTIKNLSGARLIIHEVQIPFLDELRQYLERKGGEAPVRVEKSDLVSPSRSVLQGIGIDANLVETPGHSDDSISLALDGEAAFIGDLPSPEYADPEKAGQIIESWRRLDARGVKVYYHSHTPPIPAERIRALI